MFAFRQYARSQMALFRTLGSRWLAALLLAGVVACLGIALKNRLAGPSYDALHVLAGRQTMAIADSPVVIVYLDLPAYAAAHQDPNQPWPRELYAHLLQRLTQAGVRAVLFDIVFGNAGPDPEADRQFADAIRDNGGVVLALEFNATSVVPDDRHNWARLDTVTPVYAPFAGPAAARGIASQWIEDDEVVRHYLAGFNFDRQPTLTWAAATWLQLPATRAPDALAQANQKWLRYYGPPLTIPHVNVSQALATNGVADDFFHNKIVLVGARPQVERFNARKDEFRNPFHSWQYDNYFMPGVEVHATEMLNLLRGDWLGRTTVAAENGWLVLVALGFSVGLMRLRPLPATAIALAGMGLVPALALAGFARGLWFPWIVVSAVQIPAALFGSWLWQFQEWFFTRRKLEAARRQAEATIREQAALIDKAHDAILVQNLSGRILHMNPSAEKLYGWKFSELRPGTAVELFSPQAERVSTARAVVLENGEWNGELELQTRPGRVVIVESRWTLIRDAAGQPEALLLINSDITEKKVLEQQFLRTQRMNTIGTLAGGMAHDLNNALSPVLLGAQLLRRRTRDEHDGKLLTMIETSALRGADIVRQVLLFARGRGGEFECLKPGPLLKELETLVRETFPKSIAIETYLPVDLWPVRGNLTQIHQMLLNLCVNARDAMPAGGKLAFVADNLELSALEAAGIPGGRPGKFISLTVSDTGTGMPPDVVARIFEPFFTTKGEGKGTGIGLSTVLRLLKSHDGFLRVESEVGAGTAFELFLPCFEAAAPVAPDVAETGLSRGQGELILVADDEMAILELVAAELQELGYTVLTAANGAEALALFQQHAGEVRLLITDNSMPTMHGLHVMSEILKLRPGLPVIISSGEAGAAADGGVVRLNKPFALPELLAAVSRSLK